MSSRSDLALAAPRPRKRRLIVACDGTWMDSLNGLEKDPAKPVRGYPREKLQMPSNVTRLTRAIKPESSEGMSQIVYYQGGVGSSPGVLNKIVGGSTGSGLSENVREAYDFLATNYSVGDEIFLVGFSRGAFTARSVAGLIGAIGLLTKSGMKDFYAIFKDYTHSEDPDYETEYPDRPFPNKPNIRNPAYLRELDRRGLTTVNVTIKAVAVWDTVGSLGIPRVGWLEGFGLPPSMKELSFSDTVIGQHVENAFQALALDEHRGPFTPAVWERPRGSKTYLKQVWFPGVHENIGGGNDDTNLADITLAWMMSELDDLLEFSSDYILRQHESNIDYYLSRDRDPRPWSLGKIPDSYTGVYQIAGSKTRTPGCYHRVDPSTAKPYSRLLRDTGESIHTSARARYGLDGPGVDDQGLYRPRALRDYTLIASRHDGGGKPKYVRWEFTAEHRDEPVDKVLFENDLGYFERKLLAASPDVYDWILRPAPRPGRRDVAKSVPAGY